MIRFYYFFFLSDPIVYCLQNDKLSCSTFQQLCYRTFFENKEANTYKLILYTSYVSSIAAKEEAKALAHDQSGGVHCTLDFSLPLSHHYTTRPFLAFKAFPSPFSLSVTGELGLVLSLLYQYCTLDEPVQEDESILKKQCSFFLKIHYNIQEINYKYSYFILFSP